MVDPEFLRRIDHQQFFTWVVDSAMEKTLLEWQLHDDAFELSENELTRIRAAITIGASEAVIRIKELVAAALEEGEH